MCHGLFFPLWAYSSALKMDAAGSSETLIVSTRLHSVTSQKKVIFGINMDSA
jgi:hypothetical protein